MVIVEDGEPCQGACTGRGHVEAYCSGTRGRPARAARARRRTRPRTTSSRSGIRRSTEIGHHLGIAIGSLVNIFGPSVVVIGGGFGVAAFDQLLAPARRAVLREALAPAGEALEIVRARARRARPG